MTDFKYALGYNKDGVLGVAGLLGGAATAESNPGFLFLPSSNEYPTPFVNGYRSTIANGIGEYDTITSPQLPATFASINARGNGYTVFAYNVGYTPSGTPTTYYLYDGEINAVAPIESSIGLINLVGSNYSQSISGISYQESTNKFYVSIYANMGSRLFSTSDFVEWEELGVTPFFGLDPKLFVVNEDGSMAFLSTYGNTYYYSADGISWTSSYAYLPGGSYPTKSLVSASGRVILIYSNNDYWNTFYRVQIGNSVVPFGQSGWVSSSAESILSKPSGSGVAYAEIVDDGHIAIAFGTSSYSTQIIRYNYSNEDTISDIGSSQLTLSSGFAGLFYPYLSNFGSLLNEGTLFAYIGMDSAKNYVIAQIDLSTELSNSSLEYEVGLLEGVVPSYTTGYGVIPTY